jgi:hypothetical protein
MHHSRPSRRNEAIDLYRAMSVCFVLGELMRGCVVFALIAVAAACPRPARADERGADPERTIILGIGGAGELEVPSITPHAGANIMFEWEAIESWLEIEADLSILRIANGYELPIAVLFKKPFRLTPRFEYMIGLGPQVVRVAGATTETHYGGEVALDLMYWHTPRSGAWVEPAYDFTLGTGASQSLGITAGAMVGW